MDRLVLKYGVLKQIANGEEIQGVCLRGAQSAAAQATAISHHTYIVDVRKGKFRAHARATTQPTRGAFFAEWRTGALRYVHPKI